MHSTKRPLASLLCAKQTFCQFFTKALCLFLLGGLLGSGLATTGCAQFDLSPKSIPGEHLTAPPVIPEADLTLPDESKSPELNAHKIDLYFDDIKTYQPNFASSVDKKAQRTLKKHTQKRFEAALEYAFAHRIFPEYEPTLSEEKESFFPNRAIDRGTFLAWLEQWVSRYSGQGKLASIPTNTLQSQWNHLLASTANFTETEYSEPLQRQELCALYAQITGKDRWLRGFTQFQVDNLAPQAQAKQNQGEMLFTFDRIPDAGNTHPSMTPYVAYAYQQGLFTAIFLRTPEQLLSGGLSPAEPVTRAEAILFLSWLNQE